MKHLRAALIFGIVIGIGAVLFLYSPPGRYVEDEFGLALLFKVRGTAVPPSDAVIINLDEKSAEQLNLPQKIEDWPRNVYADLVTVLAEFGAAVIVFDVHFGDAQNEVNDRAFAAAMRSAGNVVLYQKMVRKISGTAAGTASPPFIDIEQELPPIDILADAALESASFPIPKMPVRVNQAWTFKTSAGDLPTLPVVALQALTLDQYHRFYEYVETMTGADLGEIPAAAPEVTGRVGLMETMRRYRQLLGNDRDQAIPAGPRSPGESPGVREEAVFRALLDIYRGPNNIYINFYGPPATFTTYSLADVRADAAADSDSMRAAVAGKVVFVGAARTSWSEQKDGFYTVFTQANGLDLSGVEIAATVYANLRDGTHLKVPSFRFTAVLIICSAILFAVAAFSFNPPASLAALLTMVGLCLVAGTRVFSLYAVKLPVITWIIVLPPILFGAAIVFKFITVRRERAHIRQALHLYLPDNVVEELTNDLSFVRTGDRMVYGVCLTTDARNYTTLSERIEPQELSSVMKNYFDMMFRSVHRYDGLVCNVIGDSMFALWPSTEPDITAKKRACAAALGIIETIDTFNTQVPEHALPTRIGLHCGYLLMGNIGAEGHYEYAPVGDIVNTASRIENVNKKLGTHILASEETVKECGELDTRLMGTFLLSGKSNPVTLFQVLPEAAGCADLQTLHEDAFPAALSLFQAGRWDLAQAAFEQCAALIADDGPSRFYVKLCSKLRQNPPDSEWTGIISLQK